MGHFSMGVSACMFYVTAAYMASVSRVGWGAALEVRLLPHTYRGLCQSTSRQEKVVYASSNPIGVIHPMAPISPVELRKSVNGSTTTIFWLK